MRRTIAISDLWDFKDNAKELITLPIFQVGLTVSLMSFIILSVCLGFPTSGVSTWLLLPGILICIESVLFTVLWDNLNLPLELKLQEFLVSVAVIMASSWFAAVGAGVHRSSSFWLQTVFLLTGWYMGSAGALAIGKVMPGPKRTAEERVIPGFIEIVIGARIKKNLYGVNEIMSAKDHWHKYLIRAIAIVALFGFSLHQYGRPLPNWQLAILTLFLGAFFCCGLAVKITIDSVWRREYGRQNRIFEIGSFDNIKPLIYLIPGVLALAGMMLPADLSPLAAENLDELSERVNDIMGAVTNAITNVLFAPPASNDVKSRPFYISRIPFKLFRFPSLKPHMGTHSTILTYCILVLALLTAAHVISATWYSRRKTRVLSTVRKSLRFNLSLKGLSLRLALMNFVSWIRFILSSLLQPPEQDRKTESFGNPMLKIINRCRRYIHDRLMPADPGKAIRYLYMRMLRLGEEHGFSRSRSMTPNEYQGILVSKASSFDGDSAVRSVSEGIYKLTQAYIVAKYSPTLPRRSLFQQAMQSWNTIKANIRRYFRRTAS